MKSVYKYLFHSLHGFVTIYVPYSAKLLRVDKQGDTLAAWFEVETESTEGSYYVFYVAMTGEDIPDNLEYVNTVLFDDGNYVLHIYKEIQ
jgi:hypothetical protein